MDSHEPVRGERPIVEVEVPVVGAAVVKLRGEHDLSTQPAVAEALASAVEQGAVLIDLSECTFIDSSLLSAVKAARQRLDERQGVLAVLIPPEARIVRRTAHIARLEEIAPIVESPAEALARILPADSARSSGSAARVSNPLNLTSTEFEALRGLRSGAPGPGADDAVWDGLEQFGLVESRERAHERVLTRAGQDYLAAAASDEPASQ